MNQEQILALQDEFFDFVYRGKVYQLISDISREYEGLGIEDATEIMNRILERVMPTEDNWIEEDRRFDIPFETLASQPIRLTDREYDSYLYSVECEYEDSYDEEDEECEGDWEDYALDKDILEDQGLELTQPSIEELYHVIKTDFYGGE